MRLLTLPPNLPIARYRFTFEMTTPLTMPPYAASTLRGIFGHALLDTICTCERPASDGRHPITCPYSHIFAPATNNLLPSSIRQNPPPPYIIETPFHQQPQHYPSGSEYTFQIVLTGAVQQLLPLIKTAFAHAFQKGVSRSEGKGRLKDIQVQQQNQWQSILKGQHLQAHYTFIDLPQQFPQSLTLHLNTPLTIQQNKKIIRATNLTEQLLLSQAMRDISNIATTHWPQPLQGQFSALLKEAAQVTGQRNLTDVQWQRHSNRQQRHITYFGVTGSWQLHNLPPEFAALLYIGQWLHIGKETTFGHGSYQIHPHP